MLGISRKHTPRTAPPPPAGVEEVVVCVFDEKRHLLHHFRSSRAGAADGDIRISGGSGHPLVGELLNSAIATRQPVSAALTHGEGRQALYHVLPYEVRRGKWRFACLQLAALPSAAANPASICSMADDRACLLLVDASGTVRAVGAIVPGEFDYTAGNLVGTNLADLFAPSDLRIITSCSADTSEAILSCAFLCRDGPRRDVAAWKYAATDGCSLFAICDVPRPRFNEEIGQACVRERRRIGQDLHDSIGQLLTGISLLGRSLANNLQRGGRPDPADAAQISELADDASNQIRQISRGLMSSDIVHRGLHSLLRDLARTTTNSCGLRCEANLDETVAFADGAVETHLFRIAQEAVNNAVRHAEASRIDIVVAHANGMPRLEIRDNGTWKGMPGSEGGIGMKTMKYRASVVGGQLQVGAAPAGGTQVVCVLETDEALETGG